VIKCGKTGATLLYGTKCVGCDCQLARFADGGFVRDEPGTVRVMGFDLASGPDKAATVHARVGKDYSFVIDDIELMEVNPRIAEQIADIARRQREAIEDAILGRKRWEHAGDARPRSSHWGGAPHRQPYEIITDPADRRGFDAKPIGGTRP
jgi:hypothetical protein